MAYAEVEDVEVYYGAVTDDQRPTTLTLIEQAEAQIAQRIPDLDARVTTGRTSAPLVRQVVSEMVAEVLRNPEGYVQGTRSVSNGPFSETTSGTISAGATAGRLVLTRRHLGLLGARRGAQSVPVGDDALRHPVRSRWWRDQDPTVPATELTWPDPWDGTAADGSWGPWP